MVKGDKKAEGERRRIIKSGGVGEEEKKLQ